MVPQRNIDWKSSWRIRRWFMFGVSAFCMWTVAYVLYRDLDSGPADTAVTMAFLTLLGIVGSYVFGATWEDVSKAKLLGASRSGAKSQFYEGGYGAPAYDSQAYGQAAGPAAAQRPPAPGRGASAPVEDMP